MLHPCSSIIYCNDESLNLYTYGSDTPLNTTFAFKGLARGQTRFIFFEAGPRPTESVDLDFDISFYNVHSYTTLTEHGSATIQLGRAATSTYNSIAAPPLLAHQILLKLAQTLPRLKQGDKEYRKSYANEYRTMLVTKLNPIRAEVSNEIMDAVYQTLMNIYDILNGGTTSNDLAIKTALYELYSSDYFYQGEYK